MATRRFARLPQRTAIMHLLRRHLLTWTLTAGGAVLVMAASLVLWWSRDLPDPQNIDARRVAESTKIFDRTGKHLLYEIGEVHRTKVGLDRISLHLRQTTLAAEDDQFYEHYGLDLAGIARAVFINLTGGNLQGGSTITQQLIKNSILTPERTFQRKVKEAVLAVELEQRFSKDQILEMYLNDIPYGSQTYGVEAAAQTFFGRSAADLSLGQAAVLAALPKAPTYYSPYGSHFEDLRRRQEHILDRMVSLDMIRPDQAEQAKAEKLEFSPRRESILAPHFVFYVREQLDKEYGERVVEQGGLRVTTTLDVKLQTIAEEVLKNRQAALSKQGVSNASLVALDPKSGDILAMVGSIDYFNQDIDGNVNVAIRHRSPGSSIKPFIYAAAWAKGYTPATLLVDAETDFGQGYTPKNFDLAEHGPVSMHLALANSLNIPAVQTLYLAGVRSATDLAQRMGLESLNNPDRYGLSLVLGGGEVRLVDITSGYGVFANDGVRLPHRPLLKVEDKGKTLLDLTAKPPPGEGVLDEQIARLITNTLSDNNARALVFGSRSALQLGSRPVAAKTGTTQEFRDGWTIGFTPSLATGVWVGNNDNSPMKAREPGALTAAPIWNEFMRKALEGQPVEDFVKPEPLKDVPHPILKGQLSEIKARWEPETNIIYPLDCPVNVNPVKTFKEIHSILFYVRRDNPQGSLPSDPQNDPQFDRWENAVAVWREKFNAEHKMNGEKPQYVASLPEPICSVESGEDLPKVNIIEPNTTILSDSPVKVSVTVDSPQPLKEVRFILDGRDLARRQGDDALEASFSFPKDFSGRKTLVVLAITTNNLVGRAHRTFMINPDDAPPTVILHTPKDGTVLKSTDFPQTIKITAKDSNGIEVVDVLYKKEGKDGTQRLGRTTSPSSVAADRYDVTWPDSLGPGQYSLYAVAYDKTGNVSQTSPHTITIAE